MKKNSLRSIIVLSCVPFLLGGASLVSAETALSSTSTSEVQSTESSIATTSSTLESSTINSSSSTEGSSTSSSTEEKIEGLELNPKTNKINAVIGKKDKIELKDAGTIKLSGKFVIDKKENQNGFVKVSENGNWEALKEGSITYKKLTFMPDDKTKKALQAKYKDQDFSNPLKVTDVTFKVSKKEVVNLDIKVNSQDVKNKKGQLITSLDNKEFKASYTPIKNDNIDLKEDGSFTISEKNNNLEITEKVSIKLDKDDVNFKKIADSDKNKEKEIKSEYQDIDVTINQPLVKVVKLTYTVKDLTSKINEGGKLAFQDVDGVKITGTFTEIKDDDFFSLDADGNWKAKKAGEGSIEPTFTISKESLSNLQKIYPKQEIRVATGELRVNFSETGTGTNQKEYAPVSKKQYAPVSKLPKTGEEKMRFAGIIGLIILVIVAIIFFMKRKKDDEE